MAFEAAHELGMGCILWCYLRNAEFKKDGVDYHASADMTGQANHIGSTIQADIVKQKQATNNGGYTALNFGKTHPLVYEELTTDHPVDLVRWQVANCFMGRVGLINSGGSSSGQGRPRGGGPHGCGQQASRRHRPDLGPQGLSTAGRRRRRVAQRHPGRLSLRGRHDRLTRL